MCKYKQKYPKQHNRNNISIHGDTWKNQFPAAWALRAQVGALLPADLREGRHGLAGVQPPHQRRRLLQGRGRQPRRHCHRPILHLQVRQGDRAWGQVLVGMRRSGEARAGGAGNRGHRCRPSRLHDAAGRADGQREGRRDLNESLSIGRLKSLMVNAYYLERILSRFGNALNMTLNDKLVNELFGIATYVA